MLDLRDRLGGDDVDEQQRADLSQRPAGYVELAEKRCDELRAQLAAVQDVTDSSRQQVAGHFRRRSGASGR